jgi:hypothetical protein
MRQSCVGTRLLSTWEGIASHNRKGGFNDQLLEDASGFIFSRSQGRRNIIVHARGMDPANLHRNKISSHNGKGD